MEAADILDEACEEEVSFDWLFYCLMIYIIITQQSCLIALIIQQPALLHLAEKGVSLLTR